MKFSFSSLRPCWRATALLALGSAINYGDRSAMAAVLPALRMDLRLSDFALGMLGSLFLWSYAVGSPIAGGLADRFSRNKIATVSLALWSTMMALIGCANGTTMLYTLRIGLGLSECLYLPAAIALLGDHHSPSTRARGITALLIGTSVGMIAGGTFAGFIASHYSWRLVFWTLGAAGIGLAVIFHLMLPAAPATSLKHPERPRVLETLQYIVRVPAFYIVLAKVMLAGVAVWIVATWLPLYFHDIFHMSMASAGFFGTFLPEFAGLLGLSLGAWFSDFVAARAVRCRMLVQGLGYMVAGPFFLLFLGHPSFATVAAALMCWGFFRTMSDANELSVVCEIIPSRFRSTCFGMMNTFACITGGLGVLLAGLFMHDLGLGAVFATLAAFYATAAALLLVGYFAFVRRDIARAVAYDAVG